MTTALPESAAQVDTCCWAPWRPATARKARKNRPGEVSRTCAQRWERDGRSRCAAACVLGPLWRAEANNQTHGSTPLPDAVIDGERE